MLCAFVEGGYDTASIIGLESSGRLTVFCGLNTEPTCWESCLRVSTELGYFPMHHNCWSLGLLCALEDWETAALDSEGNLWTVVSPLAHSSMRLSRLTGTSTVVWTTALRRRASYWAPPTIKAIRVPRPKHCIVPWAEAFQKQIQTDGHLSQNTVITVSFATRFLCIAPNAAGI